MRRFGDADGQLGGKREALLAGDGDEHLADFCERRGGDADHEATGLERVNDFAGVVTVQDQSAGGHVFLHRFAQCMLGTL